MSRTEDLNWADLKLFLAIYRRLSVRGASQSLGTSHSTISRRLERLETSMGGPLFFRTPQGFVPTELAEQLVTRAERVESEIIGLERDLTGRDVELAGVLRIATTPLVSQKLLMPMLAEFSRDYPGVDLHLHASYGIADLARSQADIAIRFQEEPAPFLVGRRLPEFAESIYASRTHLSALAAAGQRDSLNWIGWSRGYSEPDWKTISSIVDGPARHDFHDPLDQFEAVRAGLGMALLPCFIGDADKDLVRVPGAGLVRKRTGWILTHPELRSSQRVQTCIRFLAKAIFRQEALISGRLPVPGPGS
ncbi:MAG: LysR family transcriptional regulator [Roseibium sp.]|uniref:LysR family transcriptional regulator n=1 Tax=Roseibium sp. TaxID=1936156 RepID=UPI001B27DFF8|nr:LysR family transcriptional regulator [Roseibium sp.]MBO6894271.1 LysR family transcriptional regulator [Roseibium sp.]MBO6933257.1 LysR family transcriptional regulator [Roseibium sp.]